MLETIIKGDVSSITAKLELKFDEYDLALSTTRRILINKTSLALLMLLYNQQFRSFCNVSESRTEIYNNMQLELFNPADYLTNLVEHSELKTSRLPETPSESSELRFKRSTPLVTIDFSEESNIE